MTYLLGGIVALGVLRVFGRDQVYKALLLLLACHMVGHWLATDQLPSKDALPSVSMLQEGTAAAWIADLFGKATLLTSILFTVFQNGAGFKQLTGQWGVRMALFYFSACSLLALVSFTPGFLWSEAWLVAFLLVFAGSRESVEAKLKAVAWYCAVLVLISLAAIPVAFPKVMDPHQGYLPFRLRGILDHANGMGMACGVGLVLVLYLTGLRFSQRVGLVVLFLIALVLAQSKTILVFTVFLLLVRVSAALIGRAHQYASGWPPARRVLLAAAVAVLAFIPFVDPPNFLGKAASLLGTTEAGALSLTGRQAIWLVTLKTWASHPLVGYGPGLWGVAFREQMGMPYAGQAHNQYLHTLGEFGILGALVLGAYLWLLGRRAWSRRRSLPAAWPLLLLLLVVGMVEAPLRDPIYRAGFLLHVALLASLSMEPNERQSPMAEEMA